MTRKQLAGPALTLQASCFFGTAKTDGPEMMCQLRLEFACKNAVVVVADAVVADVVRYQSEFSISTINIAIIVIHIVIIFIFIVILVSNTLHGS